jgi:hypothetical protein
MIATMTLEEALREIQNRAAILRYLASSAIINPETPDPQVLAGIGDVCSDIEGLAASAKDRLGVSVLDIELRQHRRSER